MCWRRLEAAIGATVGHLALTAPPAELTSRLAWTVLDWLTGTQAKRCPVILFQGESSDVAPFLELDVACYCHNTVFKNPKTSNSSEKQWVILHRVQFFLYNLWLWVGDVHTLLATSFRGHPGPHRDKHSCTCMSLDYDRKPGKATGEHVNHILANAKITSQSPCLARASSQIYQESSLTSQTCWASDGPKDSVTSLMLEKSINIVGSVIKRERFKSERQHAHEENMSSLLFSFLHCLKFKY